MESELVRTLYVDISTLLDSVPEAPPFLSSVVMIGALAVVRAFIGYLSPGSSDLLGRIFYLLVGKMDRCSLKWLALLVWMDELARGLTRI